MKHQCCERTGVSICIVLNSNIDKKSNDDFCHVGISMCFRAVLVVKDFFFSYIFLHLIQLLFISEFFSQNELQIAPQTPK